MQMQYQQLIKLQTELHFRMNVCMYVCVYVCMYDIVCIYEACT